MKFAALTLVLSLMTLSVGCNRTRSYPMQGEIVAKNAITNEVTVKHGDIPGFMEAMTMPYRVKDPAILRELQPGDKIAASVVVGTNPGDYWLDAVRITDESGRVSAHPPAAPHMLMPGEPVPDIALTNQDGRVIHLSDFGGKALLVTFIYTRCPMPDFCPRLSSQFAHIQDELKKSPADYAKTHLLTITFDPKYDTPSILRKYALAYMNGDASGFSHWDFATMDPTDLARLAQAFGLQYSFGQPEKGEESQILHTMNIVLITPNGKVAKFWSTNWTTDELLDNLRREAHAKAESAGKTS